MIKKTIKYTDYNGVEREEDFYFHLNKAELAEMELSRDGGLTEWVSKVVKEQRNSEIIKLFKDLVLNAYGVKSDDGRQFIKNEDVRNSFAQTEAYSELFMELAMNADSAAEFVNGLVPDDISKMTEKMMEEDIDLADKVAQIKQPTNK